MGSHTTLSKALTYRLLLHQEAMAIFKTVFALSLVSFCVADLGFGGGSAPDAGYGTPDAGYGTPDVSYGGDTQVSYDYEQQSYEASTGGDDLFAKLGELLPLFIAVFAAIILAQLITQPLIHLLGLLVMLIPGSLALKAPLLNFLLGLFNLQLCQVAADGTLSAFGGKQFDGRALSDAASSFGWEISADKIEIIHGFVENALHALNSENQDLPRF